ncbi:MAG: hypothetical protein QG552_1664, partial [Thermodesulfobacteriota bacterium]|nr:hypothetical protein [Thermodesulfobacteriota bacterium]
MERERFDEGEKGAAPTTEGGSLIENDNGEKDLAHILDVPAIQSLMDDFFSLTNIGVAVLDIRGKVLVATGWQDICTKFHRVHPETCRHCVESDTLLSRGVEPGTFKIYRCKNHMWDMATPIIVGGRHMGNLFLGQFFFADEEPDYTLFRAQARTYGFDETGYLAALDRVPRWEKEKVNLAMTFYSKFAQLISERSYGNLRLARTLAERDNLFLSLQKSEAQYRYLVENSNDIIWAFDIASQEFNFSSSAIERILGYPANIEKKMTLDDIFSRETKKQVLTAFGKLFMGQIEGDRVAVEAEHLHHNGGKVWMEISATVLKDGGGKPVGFTGVSRDITERKRAEETLRRNEEELQWLFKSMFNAFVLFESVFDASGRFISYRFVRINDAYERITGVKNEEVKGKTVHEVWPETEPEWIRRYGEVAVTGISQTFDLYHDPTKKLYHCMVYRPWETQDRFCVIFEDITEQKHLEAERAALQAQNWQLQKAESLGRMAGAIAHHFNNQLQVVMGNLQMAMGDLPHADRAVESMTEAMQAARRAARVSGQMLTYLGQAAGRRETLDMAETCRQTLPMLKAALPKDVAVKTDLPSPGPLVRGNSNEIQQVLTNLFTNAWEAMSETGGAIHISLKTVLGSEIPPERRFPIDWRPEDAPYACIEVRDDGPGIPEQDMEKLFDPFFSTKFTGRG